MADSVKPKHVPNISQAKLHELFNQHDFASLLPRCEQILIVPKRKRKAEDTFHAEMAEYEEGIKYRHPETKSTVAVIFKYTDVYGRVFQTIRALRIDDTVFDASPHRD